MIEEGIPVAYPVNYLLRGEEIIFATSSRNKTAAARGRRTMGFQVDEIDFRTHSGWSVLGAGEPYVVSSSTKLAELNDTMDHPWVPDHPEHRIAIPLRILHGRRLAPAGFVSDRLCTYPI
jgi:hypothetical protein